MQYRQSARIICFGCATAVAVCMHTHKHGVCVCVCVCVCVVVGGTGVMVTGLFIGYLPSDWLEDRPQVC